MLELSFEPPYPFGRGRSAVIATNGIVSTSQPLASQAGIQILQQGGNAIDAAVAAAAMLNVVEPMSTGIGGDLFAIVYDARGGTVSGLNASGRSAKAATLDECLRRIGGSPGRNIPVDNILAVTVPGTVDGWVSLNERFGRLPLSALLGPAIKSAEDGFGVAPICARSWHLNRGRLQKSPDSIRTWLTKDGNAPKAGDIFRNPNLARSLRIIAESGREGFYKGPIAKAIVEFSNSIGGLLAESDFARHRSEWTQPVSSEYRGFEILEMPPNGQGILALEALKILSGYDLRSMGHNSAEALHVQIEAMKLAMEDAAVHVTDSDCMKVSPEYLLSDEYISKRRAMIRPDQALTDLRPSNAGAASDTVYVAAADREGNVVSLINSIFHAWGSGLTAGETGIVLQNRGHSFRLDPEHINVIAPGKRTRHTILPAMMMYQGRPLMAFGCVGGDMQPQGQLQFVSNVVDFGMNVQSAIDAPRWRYKGTGANLAIESMVSGEVRDDLAKRGHQIQVDGTFFGAAQAVLVHPEQGTIQGASDARRDGCAVGY